MPRPDPAVTLKPGDAIGILGGGQLGRMLALAAAPLGLRAHIFCPDKRSPAFQVADAISCNDYEDEGALARFCASVDAVTYEFENIPEKTVAYVQARKPLRPSEQAFVTTRDRLTEKTFLNEIGVATAPYRAISSREALAAAAEALGFPCIAKTRRFGYDGKGQARLDDLGDVDAAWAALGTDQAILEAFVPFRCEVSAVIARALDGSTRCFAITENAHQNHILARSRVPARLPTDMSERAVQAAGKVVDALGYVGVLAVEFFVTEDQLLANEIAPRVHNSGHWTIEGAAVSQFTQHIRAVAGWPLADVPLRGAEIEMHNLLGDEIARWPALLADPAAHLHLYGKRDARPGRKMGHVTWVR